MVGVSEIIISVFISFILKKEKGLLPSLFPIHLLF
jgi:hypothetical protein